MTSQDRPEGTIHGTTLSSDYTVILRSGCLEFYHVDKGPWEKREAPDFLLTPDETDALFSFLLLVYPREVMKTDIFEV